MATRNPNRSRARQEEEELESAYRKMSGSRSRTKKKNKKTNRTVPIVIICIALMAIIIGITAGYLFIQNAEMNGIILENVSVAGVDVGGLTQAQAITAVEDAIAFTYAKNPIVVTVLESTAEIPTSCFKGLDVKAAVKAAYKFGNSGSAEKKQQEQQIAMTTGYTLDLTPYLELDTEKIKEVLQQVGANYSSTLAQSTYEVTGTAPTQKLIIKLGVPEYGLDMNALYNQVMEAYSKCEFQVTGVCGMIEPSPIDLKAILDQYFVAPVDASFDPDTYEIIPGTDGYGFNLDEATQKLQQAEYGSTLEIDFTTIEPEITQKTLSEMLYRDKLATYTAKATSDENRDVNLNLACKAINEVVILPGNVFCFNDLVGDPAESDGYKQAQANIANETVTITGGGISQVASSLYYCAMVADLEIIERVHHTLTVDYVPLGMDADVQYGEYDLRFRNNTDYPIRIEAESSGGTVTVTIIGTDTKDYYVELEYDVLNTYNYGLSYQEVEADNIDGLKDGDYVVEPYTGYDVKVYRCKYSKETKELTARDLEGEFTYEARDGIICEIEETASSEPTSTDPANTPGFGNGNVTDGDGVLPPE